MAEASTVYNLHLKPYLSYDLIVMMVCRVALRPPCTDDVCACPEEAPVLKRGTSTVQRVCGG